MMIAEESTSWPGVTSPVKDGGLGFDFKWNMGWMHDTLEYIQEDPIYRRYHHQQMTFGMVYAYSERFILPISHDEVVHGKQSLLAKMYGDAWQKRAQLRAYFGFMFTHPGKKLLFMGTEFGHWGEWNHDQSPEWHLLDDVAHRGIQQTVHDLNHLYRDHASLHATDFDPAGFRWLVSDDAENSVFAYLRMSDADERERPLLVICNMTPVTRYDYRIGVPALVGVDAGGSWSEIFNSDADIYGGSNLGNFGRVPARHEASHGHSHSLVLTVPAFSTLIFKKD
jgi:1,4-alpha-glucan branching enzyme